MGLENKLYLYMVDGSIKNPSTTFQLVEYNQDTGIYRCMIPTSPSFYIDFMKEQDLFTYMDEYGYSFITDNNVLGGIWKSYPMAILEKVRWEADLEFYKSQYTELIREN